MLAGAIRMHRVAWEALSRPLSRSRRRRFRQAPPFHPPVLSGIVTTRRPPLHLDILLQPASLNQRALPRPRLPFDRLLLAA